MTKRLVDEGKLEFKNIQREVYQQSGNFFKDQLLVRYTDGTHKLLNLKALQQAEWQARVNDKYWSTVAAVQVVPLSKMSYGKPICFTFQKDFS